MSRLRGGLLWAAVLGAVLALVCAGVVVADRNDAEAAQISADARARDRAAAHDQAVRQAAAARATARRQAVADKAAARRADRQRKAAELQQAADEEAARQEAAEARAARREAAAERAARRRAAKEAAAAAAAEAAGHDITGSMTEPDINGALVTRVGGHPGQPLGELGEADLAKLGRLLDQLKDGTTFPCPAGSGGGFADIASGTPVTIEDGAGKVLATTVLAGGILSARGCTFTFATSVPDADFYRVEVSDRDALTLSREQLETKRWKVSARL
jgi:hypothetical protein